MGDLIDRQAAIDVASGYCHPANIADELRKLPSAQPEVTEKQVCEYCRRRNLVMITNESFEVLKAYYERRNA